ncbi:uncharacterized protein At3g27210 isoform X2 [Ziziphus jujuba]|uniref:Uncharacterized protein At3g27210 isoform X2 n=1 Tax=Ziziphus jujuba TaxID=326968 RepID=A0A6P4BNZ1_ZIZJJ|nr:uncharacterized protein At3g27210 isoform X2 [Ziziphus jujuba]
MGNCVLVHRAPDSASRPNCSSSPNKERAMIQTSSQENPGDSQRAEFCFKLQSSSMPQTTSIGEPSSKDEMFFDSHPWIESDCEDYYSINDNTPSCNKTPNCKISLTGTPQLGKSCCADVSLNSIHKNTPTDVKKQLIELFKESFSSDLLNDYPNLQRRPEAKPAIFDPPTNPARPYASTANFVCYGETCTIANSNPRKRNASKSAKCCLPNLVRSLSIGERKKMPNPAYKNGGGCSAAL